MDLLRFLAEALIAGFTVTVAISISAVAIKDAYVGGIKERLAMNAVAAEAERHKNEAARKNALKQTADTMASVHASFLREFQKKADESIAKITNSGGGTIQ